MGTKALRLGQPAPASGQYQESGTGTEITAVRGKPLPPTRKPGRTYRLVDRTRHKPRRR